MSLIKWHPRLSMVRQNPYDLTITKQTEGGYVFAKIDPYDFYKLHIITPPDEQCYYEIIHGDRHQKPHFDVDYRGNQYDKNFILETLLNAIDEEMKSRNFNVIPIDDFMIFESHGDEKISFHVIMPRFFHISHLQSKKFYLDVMRRIQINDKEKIYDPMVYSVHQQFRIYRSTKIKRKRYKILTSQYVFRGSSVFQKAPETHGEINEIFIRSFVSVITNQIPLKEKDVVYKQDLHIDYPYDSLVTLLRKYLPGEVEIKKKILNTIMLKRLKSTFCNMCKRNHENENPYVFIKKEYTGRYTALYNCRRNEKSERLFDFICYDDVVIEAEEIPADDLAKNMKLFEKNYYKKRSRYRKTRETETSQP